VVDALMGVRISLASSSAMADSIIARRLLRCWTASNSGEVFVIVVLGGTGDCNACRLWLLIKVVGSMLVGLCVSDGGFMVVVDNGF
jgi:hypothetical protein